MFVQMMYQLLRTHKFPFKCRKIMCQGPSDSGKTTWLCPITEILDEEHIATVTKENVFCAQMLQETTRLLFIDEWTPNKKQFDQVKVLFQGDRQFTEQKNKLPAHFKYRSGVYITINNVSITLRPLCPIFWVPLRK